VVVVVLATIYIMELVVKHRCMYTHYLPTPRAACSAACPPAPSALIYVAATPSSRLSQSDRPDGRGVDLHVSTTKQRAIQAGAGPSLGADLITEDAPDGLFCFIPPVPRVFLSPPPCYETRNAQKRDSKNPRGGAGGGGKQGKWRVASAIFVLF
jgi:hypothetical protein